jgi:hypothetical protein
MKISNKILVIIFIASIISFGLFSRISFAEATSSNEAKDIEEYQYNIQNSPSTKQISSYDDDQLPFAVLQGLNKITAKTSEFKVTIGKKINFGSLSIEAKKCLKSPQDKRPENKILLKISEVEDNKSEKTIFYGWMFSSSPSISGIEHPIYDIVAINCQSQ